MQINKKLIHKKIFFLSLSLLTSSAFVGLLFSTSASARGTLIDYSQDVINQELRAVTIESWDRDYSGSGYGWQVFTNKDVKRKRTTQRPTYSPNASSLQTEREVKLIKGSSISIRENQGYDQARVLAVRFAFTFPGDNVVTIQPPPVDQYLIERPRYYLSESVNQGDTNAQPLKPCFQNQDLSINRNSKRALVVECVNGVNMPGIIEKISVWVMGRGSNYELEAWVEDWQGDLHVLKLGNINFIGWRPMSVSIPTLIPQENKSFPQTKTLIFRKFKLRSNSRFTSSNASEEPVYVFFDQLRVLMKSYEQNFDGETLSFDKIDCERKNKLYRLLRRNSRVPDQWPKLADCSTAPGPAAPIASPAN